MKINGKGTEKLLKSMKIHGNATPNLETAACLCASYAQAMREIITRPVGWLISWPLQLGGGRKYRFVAPLWHPLFSDLW